MITVHLLGAEKAWPRFTWVMSWSAPPTTYKIVVVGASSVGKSSIVQRLVQDQGGIYQNGIRRIHEGRKRANRRRVRPTEADGDGSARVGRQQEEELLWLICEVIKC
jgi:hypothetical protein